MEKDINLKKVIACVISITAIVIPLTLATDYIVNHDYEIIDYVNEIDIELVAVGLGMTIEVSTYQEFISAIETDVNANILLIKDIDFAGYTTTEKCIIMDTFTGAIDGQNNAVLNLSYPLFYETDGASFNRRS